MFDIGHFIYKGLQRGYSEDAAENDDMGRPDNSPTPATKLKRLPTRPPRKGSLSRTNGYDSNTLEPGKLEILYINHTCWFSFQNCS